MVDTYEFRKPMASWRRPPGLPRNVWLNKVQEDAYALLLSTLRRSEIARGHGAAQRFTRSKAQTPFITICCGFVVQLVVQQIRSKSY